MDDHFVHFVRCFADRRLLKKKVSLQFRDDADRPRLFCDEPAIVARFASEIRQEAVHHLGSGTRVLMRGQTDNHRGMVPGLFRRPTNLLDHNLLVRAEAHFETAIRPQLKVGRFLRPDLAALLQHYGYRTTWLDVVDNPWTAVWFATHSIVHGFGPGRTVSVKSTGSGWIYVLALRATSSGCRVIDLREAHHGLSLRPHTQSGWSVRGSGDAVSDLDRWVIACIEFPIDHRWVTEGYMASSEFMFPAVRLDHTLRRLIDKKVDAIAASVERELDLPEKCLGRLYFLGSDAA